MKIFHGNPFTGLLVLITMFFLFGSTVTLASDSSQTTQPPVLTRKAPYVIYTGDNTQMEVLWQLYSSHTSLIEWGTDSLYTLGSTQTGEYGIDHQHKYLITNLSPGRKYFYRVTTGQEVYSGSFRSASGQNATAAKFLVYGDTRSNPGTHDQVAAAMISTFTQDSLFQSIILSSGDLVSNGNHEGDWDSQFFNPNYSHIKNMLASMPYQACMGNHEGSGVLFTKYFPYPFVADRYWSFDYGPAHIVVVDQYTSYSPGSAQLTWMANDLATTGKRWKFILLHEPGWSAGHHGNNSAVQNYIQPLCEQYGVTLVIGGHNHYYARAVVNGVQHITTGGGGASLYQPNPNYPHIVATSMTHHFCKIEINGDTLNFRAVTSAGVVVDSFTVMKTPNAIAAKTKPVFPAEFELYPAYPNPFNPGTTIEFDLMRTGFVVLRIYNSLGEAVKTLVAQELPVGRYRYKWDASGLAAGAYFYQMRVGNSISAKKVLLVK